MTDGQTMSKTRTIKHRAGARRTRQPGARPEFPGQVVLVLQGGGALGAYQVGVYEAMHERRRARLGDRDVDRRDQRRADRGQRAGEPIRAAEGVLVSGRGRGFGHPTSCNSSPGSRMRRRTCRPSRAESPPSSRRTGPRGSARHIPLGVESAAYYTTEPLRETLVRLDRPRAHCGQERPPDGRCRQCPQRRDALFRQPRRNARRWIT